MSGCAAGGLIYSSTVRVLLIKRCVLRHDGARVQSTSVLVHSAALLCLDSFFIAETDMPRHQKRIKTTILAHTTTLNLLHDSVHWFIVTIDTTTIYDNYLSKLSRHIRTTGMETSSVTLAPPTHPRTVAGRPRNVATSTERNRMRHPHTSHQHDRIYNQ